MTEHYFIYTTTEADRDALAVILARSGYTVRRTKTKLTTSNKYSHYIEYWPSKNMKEHKEANRFEEL